MSEVKFPNVLQAVYEAATELIHSRDPIVPTDLIFSGRTIFRTFDMEHVEITTSGSYPRRYLNRALLIRDQKTDKNRFSGISNLKGITAAGGLYCSVDQQAQINEILHYSKKDVINESNVNPRYKAYDPSASPVYLPRNPATGMPRIDMALSRRCIVQIRLLSSVLAMDLSQHNKARAQFLARIGASGEVQKAVQKSAQPQRSILDYLSDGEDCSVARAIGLAVAHSDYLKALQVTTVRPSDRSQEELGDNLVFFGQDEEQVPALYIEKAYLFPLTGQPRLLSIQ